MRQGAHFIPNPKATLREQMHEVMRFFHYSTRTEDSYWQWVVRFLRFHKKSGVEGPEAWRHPREMGAGEVKEFLSWLATEQQVAAATQNQAFSLIVDPLGRVSVYCKRREREQPERLPAISRGLSKSATPPELVREGHDPVRGRRVAG